MTSVVQGPGPSFTLAGCQVMGQSTGIPSFSENSEYATCRPERERAVSGTFLASDRVASLLPTHLYQHCSHSDLASGAILPRPCSHMSVVMSAVISTPEIPGAPFHLRQPGVPAPPYHILHRGSYRGRMLSSERSSLCCLHQQL